VAGKKICGSSRGVSREEGRLVLTRVVVGLTEVASAKAGVLVQAGVVVMLLWATVRIEAMFPATLTNGRTVGSKISWMTGRMKSWRRCSKELRQKRML
jgi:hypothetical protein